MASIRKRGNSYQITVSNGYDITGKKILETATWTPDPGMKKRELELALNAFAVDFERDVKSGKNVKGGRMTLQEFSRPYLKDMTPPTLARTTYADYKKRLEMRILPAMGHIQIENIRQKDINNYRKMLEENYISPITKKPLSPASIKKDCLVISALLSYAVSEGMLNMNMLIYSGKISGHRKPRKEAKPRYFTMEELIRFIDALEHPIDVVHREHQSRQNGKTHTVKAYTQTIRVKLKWKLYFYISLFIGDRRGENISLTWEDINMDTNEININKSTDYVDGTMELKDTKTHNERQNAVPAYVISLARAWKAEQMQQALKLGEDWKGYHGKDYNKNFVFTQANGKQMHICSPAGEYKRIIRMYNQYVAESPEQHIPENIPPHGLRHSAAAILIANNIDVRTVAGILGHADPSTTLNIYSYFFKNKGIEASSVMEQQLLSHMPINDYYLTTKIQ